jgi:hypothetical protein
MEHRRFQASRERQGICRSAYEISSGRDGVRGPAAQAGLVAGAAQLALQIYLVSCFEIRNIYMITYTSVRDIAAAISPGARVISPLRSGVGDIAATISPAYVIIIIAAISRTPEIS